MRKNLRDVTRPVRSLKTKIKNFFAYDFLLLIRKKLPFLRHTGQAIKPRENTVLYIITAVVIAALLTVSIIQVGIYTKTIRDTNFVKRDTAELINRLNGDMTKYSIEEAEATLRQVFTSGELTLITQRYFEYQLLINNKPYSPDTTYKAGPLKIEAVEKFKNSQLPPKILYMGSSTGGDTGIAFETYVRVEWTTPFVSQQIPKKPLPMDNGYAVYFDFEPTAGSTVSITLQQHIAERLKLPSNLIQLKIQ